MSTDNIVLDPELFKEFEDFDGSDTILVPNEITTLVPGTMWEGPQVVASGEKLLTYPVRMTWQNLRLVSTSLRETDAITREGRIDWNAVLVGKRELEIEVGGQWISDISFLALLVKQANKANGKMDGRSVAEIVNQFRQRGLDLGNQMPMFLQHLGADPTQWAFIAAMMRDAGAEDSTDRVRTTGTRTRTLEAYRLADGGLPVLSFDQGIADRSRSRTGNGFIGFFDASVTTAVAINRITKQLVALDAIINSDEASAHDKEAAESERQRLRTYWYSGNARDRRPFHHHGGTQIVEETDGTSLYYPTPVPCGSLTVLLNGTERQFSVWPSAATLAARAANGDEQVPSGLEDAVAGAVPSEDAEPQPF